MVEKLSRSYDDRTEEEKSLKMNFWIPENTPESKRKAVMVISTKYELTVQPSKEIQCPCGTHEITMKKVYALNFAEIEEGGEKVYF